MRQMAELLDPIVLGGSGGSVYVRTGRGYHVPIETMTAEQLFDAWYEWDVRLRVEAELARGAA